MIKKEIFIGFIVGIAANLVGMFIYISAFSKYGLTTTLEISYEEGYLGSIISLGAILNFLPFFVFLRKNKPYRSRGVLIASIFAALVIIITKII
ncbi:uncharacterized BrkB/YihY/UPF0761 family membrane protein [Mesonia hippocampi]|uniref:Uncharacterized BrkB/YihY/UPF0761 family membrane protein n=1 Tax=Mesonia hippocampi TaxID=1628250 RepID=A0A840EQR9_9FLAO|nr:hypothetical protein [Mesonia hippocampi]MBB4119391.1 uncharacterized BrkB/YihY/UPF0761 family membrane protein [Mesonia hippocampi]